MNDPTRQPQLTAAAQTALDAVGDDELGEAQDLCTLVGIPAEYARNLAAALAACATQES